MTVFICRENRLENAKIFAQAAGKNISRAYQGDKQCPAESRCFDYAMAAFKQAREHFSAASDAKRMPKVGSPFVQPVLDEVQSRAKVRTVSAEALAAACARAEEDLEWAGLPRLERPGARLLLAVGADEKVAKCYRGEFAGTRLTLVRRTAGWYLEKADRGEVRSFQQRLVFTEMQMPIIQKKMMERAAELSRGL